jgi:hypothetical protein
LPTEQEGSRMSIMKNYNEKNMHKQNNPSSSSFDDFVFNPKTATLEPKCNPIPHGNLVGENTDLKEYDSILTCDHCQMEVGFFSIADVRPYINSPMFLCIACLRKCDRANLSDEAQVWFEDENSNSNESTR